MPCEACRAEFTPTTSQGHFERDCPPRSPPAKPSPSAAAHVPKPPLTFCSNQLFACIHRGPEIRQEPCETRGGDVRIKIFACAIYGECQVGDTVLDQILQFLLVSCG